MHRWSSKTLEILVICELRADHGVSACVLGRVSPSPSQESLNSSKSDTDAGVCTLDIGRGTGEEVRGSHCSVMPDLHCCFIQRHIKEFLACVFEA